MVGLAIVELRIGTKFFRQQEVWIDHMEPAVQLGPAIFNSEASFEARILKQLQRVTSARLKFSDEKLGEIKLVGHCLKEFRQWAEEMHAHLVEE